MRERILSGLKPDPPSSSFFSADFHHPHPFFPAETLFPVNSPNSTNLPPTPYASSIFGSIISSYSSTLMAESGGSPFFSCRSCHNPLALRDDLISKKFLAKSGPAYMFSHAMNVIVGQKEDRKLITGVFSVADIYCSNCGEVLGWKYIRAYEQTQMYKQGKFIIERAKISKQY